MLLTLSTRKPDPLIKYNLFKAIVIERESMRINDVNFHIPTLIKEVRSLGKKKQKEYKKVIQTFLATTSTFMFLPLKSMAAELPTQNLGTTTLPKVATGMPQELLDLLLMFLVIVVGSAVVLSAIALTLAGLMRVFRKRKEASEWTIDILKGLCQILVAVPVVFLIYYVANLLFSGNGWFVSPF